MKVRARVILIITSILLSIGGSEAQLPFNRGVNLTGWFQKGNARQVQFTKFTKQDFENIKSLGCDVIRLPINLHFMTNGEPDYELDPLFLDFLDGVVDWAEELELHLILDNHTFDPAVNTSNDVGDILLKVWPQMAEHFKSRSKLLYYEVLNEPHGIADALWGSIQQDAIEAIRKIDTIHTIVVGPAGWNSYNNLKYLPEYDDDNLIYTFHFYDPFLFTHQGASWTDPSMVPLTDIPFPYHADSMPEFPDALKGTWIEGSFNDYKNHGNSTKIRELLDIAIEFGKKRKVPTFCGEFGVYIPNSKNDDRVRWYDTVSNYLSQNGIAWTIWDYTGGFGLFEEGGGDMFEYDLNIPLVEALGFNVPGQKEYVPQKDTVGFKMYFDYIEEKIQESSYSNQGLVDYYSEAKPHDGKYCIYWTGVSQYNHIGFDFKPDKDLSQLVEEDYALDMLVRGISDNGSFDIRFVDTKTAGPDDHPWRMRYTLNDSRIPWDGKWHHLRIPLTDFAEHGSWDDGWFNPEGKFDWSAVDVLQIVAEHHPLNDDHFWFDNIHVSNMDTVEIRDTSTIEIEEPVTSGIYAKKLQSSNKLNVSVSPQPLIYGAEISFNLPVMTSFNLGIFDATGKEVFRLRTPEKVKGKQVTHWDGSDHQGRMLSNGIYFYTISAGRYYHAGKIIIAR